MMNLSQIGFSLADVQWIVMVAIGIYSWFIGRGSATNAEMIQIRERVVKLEVQMKNMPTEASVKELIGKLEALTAHNEGTKDQLDVMHHQLNRINDFLLNKK